MIRNAIQDEDGAQCLKNLSLSHRMVDQLWLPNVCIVNSKGSSIHQSPTPNIFLAIFPNGTVWMNYRLAIINVFRSFDIYLPMLIPHLDLVTF